ncbi:uncharacterized protein LOC122388363 [Amphibalanus amphitrite]|uniref:uncharacterized protein LOC122388363 n=1 Tax=Amphibalanus amphitrite TaxID=1232801 RepID=UPI001C8FCE55|nr:uncharacterized protein LOC122388363 [Amphibalanus amphitrite]
MDSHQTRYECDPDYVLVSFYDSSPEFDSPENYTCAPLGDTYRVNYESCVTTNTESMAFERDSARFECPQLPAMAGITSFWYTQDPTVSHWNDVTCCTISVRFDP